jgi:hypothetical protein
LRSGDRHVERPVAPRPLQHRPHNPHQPPVELALEVRASNAVVIECPIEGIADRRQRGVRVILDKGSGANKGSEKSYTGSENALRAR